MPLLVGLTMAGTMAVWPGTASAGAWFYTGYRFDTYADCYRFAVSNADNYGWAAFDCREDNPTIYPLDLFAYEG